MDQAVNLEPTRSASTRSAGMASSSSAIGPSVASLLASCLALAAAIIPASLVIAAIVNRGFGGAWLVNAAIGGGICFVAAALALSTTYWGQRLNAPVQAMLAGMLFRMGLPLGVLTVISQRGGSLATSGVTTTILGVYLVSLVTETLLALRLIRPPARMTLQ
jgi:hypothetical protein